MVETTCIKPELVDGIDSGDIIRIKTNIKGKITNVLKYYDYSEGKVVNSTNTVDSTFANYYDTERNITGYVFSKYKNFLSVISDISGLTPNTTYSDVANKIELHKGDAYKTYIYDSIKRTDRISVGNADSVHDFVNYGASCSKVFLGIRYGDPMIMVIYK